MKIKTHQLRVGVRVGGSAEKNQQQVRPEAEQQHTEIA
jgi:hypothetical protein